MSSVKSIDELLDMISSKLEWLWAKMDSIARRSVFSPLNTGIPTLTFGELARLEFDSMFLFVVEEFPVCRFYLQRSLFR